MNGRGGEAPPANGGEFLLQLLRNPPNSNPPTPLPPQPQQQTFSQDPAVAAVGRTIPTLPLPHAAFPSNGPDFPYYPWNHSPPPPFAPHNYFQQNPNANPNLNPDFSSPPGGFNYTSHQSNLQSNRIPLSEDTRKLGSYGDNFKPSVARQQEQNLVFGSLTADALRQGLYQKNKLGNSYMEEALGMDRNLNRSRINSIEVNGNARGSSSVSRGYEQERSTNSSNGRNQRDNGISRAVAPPPGFSSYVQNLRNRESAYGRRISDHNVDKGKRNSGDFHKNVGLSNQLDSPGPPAGSSLQSVLAFDIEESMMEFHGENGENNEDLRYVGQGKMNRELDRTEMDDLEDQLVDSLGLEDESGEKSDKKKHHRDKDYRSDKRGKWIMSQRMRIVKRQTACRSDIERLNDSFLAVFASLIPADEEKVKQKQLLTVLEKLVGKEWPEARLYLYGSCANSFGFPKSDIDVCLVMELGDIDKSEVLLKLADILQSDNLQNVQALTRARVPIVKLMDPITSISCDICVNNVLAVVNTKLLHDYAQIDVRLRQLAFIVKHWAKSRGVNETYQGTLSSYAYVLMCIHFLQQRRPAILPCLQAMEVTYVATVDSVECAYFDQVDKLQSFGSRNGEKIGQLVWAFFHYWAYCHDYANDVISVRTGSTLSKRAKDWTRRVGNDRHLICIEDPFEISHDLGRVVDKYSIRVLREEFERAAEIMQYDPNPSVTLFEPYVPN
ncbi:Polynucleotide adenylyltransferase [Handroanthus impetiginosus]|uniref:RNA uridylyltransferase n=1 Tax=Handroanthus impetiginosus TaxID=429701 RepID=A0A2G9GMT7_9LAMI|nr:Polynucleotide adenylyltransferase [Handroanthus impetiginosus]